MVARLAEVENIVASRAHGKRLLAKPAWWELAKAPCYAVMFMKT